MSCFSRSHNVTDRNNLRREDLNQIIKFYAEFHDVCEMCFMNRKIVFNNKAQSCRIWRAELLLFI